jgi:ribose 5-phosphate isomerase B
MPERILIASDAGFELKEKLERALRALGYDVEDLGTNSTESTDYAGYAHPLAPRSRSLASLGMTRVDRSG